MRSNGHASKLPLQTKMVLGFVITLTLALVLKWVYFAVFSVTRASQIEKKYSTIKTQINDVCLKEESKGAKNAKNAGDGSEEDSDWMSSKAPEFCKCVSGRMLALWGEQEKLESLNGVTSEKLDVLIVSQLKNEEARPYLDFCLSKAQKITGRKMTADSGKN